MMAITYFGFKKCIFLGSQSLFLQRMRLIILTDFLSGNFFSLIAMPKRYEHQCWKLPLESYNNELSCCIEKKFATSLTSGVQLALKYPEAKRELRSSKSFKIQIIVPKQRILFG